MLKSYNELRQVNVEREGYCEKKIVKGKEFTYLNYMRCVDLLHEHGAESVYFEPLTKEDGSSLFMSSEEFGDPNGDTNRAYEVRVKIIIDDLEFVMNYPLINGSYVIKKKDVDSLKVHNAQARAFVKGVAIRTGLGIGLWLKEIEADETYTKTDEIIDQDVMKYKRKLGELISLKLQNGVDVVKELGYEDMDELRAEVQVCNRLASLEKKVAAL